MPPFAEGKTMDLLLWRHAEAEEGPVDHDRALTARGHKQARLVGRWILQHQPKRLKILASPTLRTRQTAEALGLPFDISRELGPESGVSQLIAACDWPSAGGAVLLVGHQPGLGHLASLLLCGQESDLTVKKGALWWLTNRVRAGEQQTVLRTVIAPEFLE